MAYTTAIATATQDPSHVCDLSHSSWQCQIPDPLSKAMDQTHILMDANQIHFCSMMETPLGHVLINIQYVILLNISFSKHRLNLFRHVDFFRGTFLPLLKFHHWFSIVSKFNCGYYIFLINHFFIFFIFKVYRHVMI